jgi:hypothetical protein
MKTKSQRQNEALVRRERDLADLLVRFEAWKNAVKVNSHDPIEYRECVVATCPLDEPNGYPDGYDEFCEIYNSYRRFVTVEEGDTFWRRKIAAVTRDIENLKKKLGMGD